MKLKVPEVGSVYGPYRVVKIEQLGRNSVVVFVTGKSTRQQALGLDSWCRLIQESKA